MLFATLDLSDLACIALVVLFIVSASVVFRPSDRARLARIESKLDALIQHDGVPYAAASSGHLSPDVMALADQNRKIEAIALLREQTGLGLKEAKDAVEAYQNRAT